LVGKREIKPFSINDIEGLKEFNQTSIRLLKKLPRPDNYNFNELSPSHLSLDADAQELLLAFLRGIEENSSENSYYSPIVDFSENALEHICRIAGILTVFADHDQKYINKETIKKALVLFHYYSQEVRRIQEFCAISEKLSDAIRLINWLQAQIKKQEVDADYGAISVRYVLQYAHPTLRVKDRLEKALKILEDHYWIRRRLNNRDIVVRTDLKA
jgi:hypothetical protein